MDRLATTYSEILEQFAQNFIDFACECPLDAGAHARLVIFSWYYPAAKHLMQ